MELQGTITWRNLSNLLAGAGTVQILLKPSKKVITINDSAGNEVDFNSGFKEGPLCKRRCVQHSVNDPQHAFPCYIAQPYEDAIYSDLVKADADPIQWNCPREEFQA